MRTGKLIDFLVKDLRPEPSLDQVLGHALIAGVLIAGAVSLSHLGIRQDIGDAIRSARFLSKLAVTSTLAASSAMLFFRLGKPGTSLAAVKLMLLVSPMLLIGSTLIELSVAPSGTWVSAAIGHNGLTCLTIIPLLSLGPLMALLYGMRGGAPSNPGVAGMIAGLTSAGMAATLYALSCNDDSPLFIMVWYPVATGIVSIAGYVLGRRLLQW